MTRSSRRSSRRWGKVDISRYVAICLIIIGGCTCNDLAGPEAQLRAAAKGLESTREIPEARLNVWKLEITRVTPEPELTAPRVVFSYDLDGTVPVLDFTDATVGVSAIGVERQPMTNIDGTWKPSGPFLPRLAEVLRALEQRDEARHHNPRALQWVIRVDLDKVLVTEEQSGQTRQMLELRPVPDGGLVFTP